MKKNKVIISQIGDKYYWTSREGKELIKNSSGVYVNYVSPEGAGYTKVSILNGTFMEHVNLGLNTITYWGVLERP